MDDHSGWDNIPEEMRPYVEGRVKAVIEKAVNHADSQANGWGNMPASMQAEIRRSVSNIINWRSVLRQFVGTLVRGERTTSIKRINRRFPYIHPGVKRGYTAKLAVAIDQSGSVDDAQLVAFFAELASLTKRISVDIIPFDTYIDPKDVYEWRKGSNITATRVRGGGTDFNAPTMYVNDPKNRGKYDGILIFTDGEAPMPAASRVKRGWVLSKGRKLLFDSDELQVFMDDSKPMTGAWR
jgi:predicted metal-dependent peptidase